MPLERQRRVEEKALTMQEREMHRYYQPWLDAHGSAMNVAAHVDSIARRDLKHNGYKPKSSQDKSLTAFAQLATLRLNVKRCMISLIDSTHQYVLAEATKTLSLVDDERHGPADELWLGSTVLARSDAVCSVCLTERYTVIDERTGHRKSGRGAVIPDLRLDDRYKEMPYVKQEPGLKFYAGVPIMTRNGIMIGAYAVSNDVPREPLTADEFSFMQDIAAAVMDHLEWARDRVDRYKGERIVKGLADFIEGTNANRVRPTENHAAKEKEGATQEEEVPQEAAGSAEPTSHLKRRSGIRTPRSSRSPAPELRTVPASPRKSTESPERDFLGKGDSLTRMLDRAAKTLRESTLADGVVFFGSLASNLTNTKQTMDGLLAADQGEIEASSKRSSREISTEALEQSQQDLPVGADAQDIDMSSDSDANSVKYSKIMGLSLADNNSEDSKLLRSSAFSVTSLEKYFEKFPHGKSFHFTDMGAGLSSSSEDEFSDGGRRRTSVPDIVVATQDATEQVINRKRKNKMNHTELLKKIPGIRNLIFLPLWDFVDEKWVAGGFIWTSTPGRMMNLDDDLSYLRAFGNSIMSEVARMNALKDDRAKTTFIASMSHELRSPLHGILGSVEFLQDTAADSYQSGLINSIATCGKTLLDTLDHVLDYAKINKLGRSKLRKQARQLRTLNGGDSGRDASTESLSITAEVDLGLLVEEVVEAVCAGHAFKKMHTGELSSQLHSSDLHKATKAFTSGGTKEDGFDRGAVAVLLDVSPRRSWMVRTQPGAIRRIIMNLLGNALKYTHSGFVAVSLRAQQWSADDHKFRAVFRVVDSGKGMSEEYQQNKLFIPFSQEDPFQPGTGLGLSIVRQIVDSLRGTIDLKSVQDVGTEVDISMSLQQADNAIQEPERAIMAVTERTKGLKLCLLDPNREKQRTVNDHIARLDTTIGELCAGWFKMDIISAQTMEDVQADMFLFTEPPSVEYLLENHGKRFKQSTSGKEIPLIIVCMNASEAISVSANHIKKLSELGRIVEVIPQPCGPRKMARVLHHCLRQVDKMSDNPPPVQKVSPPTSPPVGDSNTYIPLDAQNDVISPPVLTSFDRNPLSRDSSRSDVPHMVPPSAAVAFPGAPPLDPAAPGIDQAIQRSDSLPMRPRPDTPHLLLVDDNRINLQLLVMFMKKHNFSYEEATNGQEALDTYITACTPASQSQDEQPQPHRRRFDYVLMDISMPVMDGLEATRRIREFEQENNLSRTTVIALTGLASAQAQREAEGSGVDIYLAKPVKFQELRGLLEMKK